MTKVVFFGTSDRSIPILEALHKNFDLIFCVTKTDTKLGRHQATKESGVNIWANQNRVKCVTTDAINSDTESDLVEQIIDSGISIGVVADFSFMISEAILKTPKLGFVNIHFSLLPKYRGASPIQAAIINGDKKTGITFHVTEKSLDTGPILKQIEYPLTGKETSGQLYEILFKKAAESLPQVLNDFVEGKTQLKKQDHSKATYTYSKSHPKQTIIFKEDAKINWNESEEIIERKIRAYDPWPIAWTTLGELTIHYGLILREKKDPSARVKIYKAEIAREMEKINGALKILKLQVAGKAKTDWESFVNGYTTPIKI